MPALLTSTSRPVPAARTVVDGSGDRRVVGDVEGDSARRRRRRTARRPRRVPSASSRAPSQTVQPSAARPGGGLLAEALVGAGDEDGGRGRVVVVVSVVVMPPPCAIALIGAPGRVEPRTDGPTLRHRAARRGGYWSRWTAPSSPARSCAPATGCSRRTSASPAGDRRRVPGLRREEVASSPASASTTSCGWSRVAVRTRRRRCSPPSPARCGSTTTTVDELFQLAGSAPPPPGRESTELVRPSVLRLLDRLDDLPGDGAQRQGRHPRVERLAPPCSATGPCAGASAQPHLAAVPRARRRQPGRDRDEERAATAAQTVATLRTALARYPKDPGCSGLLAELRAAARAFDDAVGGGAVGGLAQPPQDRRPPAARARSRSTATRCTCPTPTRSSSSTPPSRDRTRPRCSGCSRSSAPSSSRRTSTRGAELGTQVTRARAVNSGRSCSLSARTAATCSAAVRASAWET